MAPHMSYRIPAALKLLMEGTSVLEKISLRPDRKASPSSLPARSLLFLGLLLPYCLLLPQAPCSSPNPRTSLAVTYI